MKREWKWRLICAWYCLRGWTVAYNVRVDHGGIDVSNALKAAVIDCQIIGAESAITHGPHTQWRGDV